MLRRLPTIRGLAKEKLFYKSLRKLLGFYPRNIEVYKIAFTHKSASLKREGGKFMNNERLEYLGDAILDAVIAEYLYEHFPEQEEGFLTKMRARIVSREKLNEIACNLGLPKLVRSHIPNNGTKNIFGNALEALIGAVFIDSNYKKTKRFITNRIIERYIDLSELKTQDPDYKSKLIEWAQKNRKEIQFENQDNHPEIQYANGFISFVYLDQEEVGSGTGLSKKEAQQHAAHQALLNIGLIID